MFLFFIFLLFALPSLSGHLRLYLFDKRKLARVITQYRDIFFFQYCIVWFVFIYISTALCLHHQFHWDQSFLPALFKIRLFAFAFAFPVPSVFLFIVPTGQFKACWPCYWNCLEDWWVCLFVVISKLHLFSCILLSFYFAFLPIFYFHIFYFVYFSSSSFRLPSGGIL